LIYPRKRRQWKSRLTVRTDIVCISYRPICGDYNDDGKQDIAIYRSSNNSFYWLNSPNFDTFSAIQFGQPGDFAVAGLRSF
jgi:hypothetical protein